jgi:imidazolonepropionase
MPTPLLISNISRLATVPGPGPRRGDLLNDAGLIKQAAMLIQQGEVAWVGPESDLPAAAHDAIRLDARGRAIVPGFVDPHTHALFASDRVDEFERRLQGVSYQQILAEGGGILSTVAATRAASEEELVAQTSRRLETMLDHGTTTVEIKTGYGLDLDTELKMLRAIRQLIDRFAGVLTIVPTFLPAHAIPPEHRETPDRFVDQIISEILPAALTAYTAQPANLRPSTTSQSPNLHPSTSEDPPLFADVFCETGAFSLDQTRRILTRARELGYRLKVHSDEFDALGGTTLAADLGAVSADHLMATGPEEITHLAASDTIATFLPGTTFGLAKPTYARARDWVAAGAGIALATDLNPGTCYCPSMPFMMALATRYLHLTPAEALVASTLNAAHALGLGHRLGSLTPGYAADFVILDTPDERHLSYRFATNLAAAVFKGGHLVAGSL